MNPQLFSPTKLGRLTLKNRIAMAPMTRTRANHDHVPKEVMAEYYAQRASAGLLIAEATASAANGAGYARMPGIYTPEQIRAWKKVTSAVHREDGKIFLQIVHTGRISHASNLDPKARVVAPSAVRAPGEVYTDAHGMQPFSVPLEMTLSDVENAIREFVDAAKNAIEAGFDGVEIHGANGYLIEQFIRPNSNRRTDRFGGPIENRARFLLEVVERTGNAIGFDRVGVRISPRGTFNDMAIYPEIDADYRYIAEKLSELRVIYLHVLDHSATGVNELSAEVRDGLRKTFQGTYIAAGGYDASTAQTEIASEYAQLVAIGRPFIANPDLVERYRAGLPLNEADGATIYGVDEKGYSDYPAYSAKSA
jgi:N-ethylmaleimide reductase